MLDLYPRKPGSFTEEGETAGCLPDSHAAVARSGARTHDQVEQAVTACHLVGEAMGILMGSRHLTEDRAFDVPRREQRRDCCTNR
ncbi:ANTAR domain-containing protein [Streptomyces sp. NPDC096105]|uniref:ANTAR domain-containing protein n=1 Tax=Streptomyces sp. NPDC096105 TaxID=3366074 RepID=UPI0037F27865